MGPGPEWEQVQWTLRGNRGSAAYAHGWLALWPRSGRVLVRCYGVFGRIAAGGPVGWSA